MPQIDFARLQEIAKKVDTLQQGQLLGKFNPGAHPENHVPHGSPQLFGLRDRGEPGLHLPTDLGCTGRGQAH